MVQPQRRLPPPHHEAFLDCQTSFAQGGGVNQSRQMAWAWGLVALVPNLPGHGLGLVHLRQWNSGPWSAPAVSMMFDQRKRLSRGVSRDGTLFAGGVERTLSKLSAYAPDKSRYHLSATSSDQKRANLIAWPQTMAWFVS